VANLYFDDWGVGSDLDAGARLVDAPGGGMIDPMWIQAGSQVLGQALKPSGAPSYAESGGYNSISNDFSGFVVDFGPGSATSSAGIAWYVWVLLALVALIWIKKGR
jgi:hypothetical protein